MENSLKTLYNNKICQELQKQFNYSNIHEIPKLIKITINRGLGEAANNTKIIEKNLNEIRLITGQKPKVTKSKKAIAGFKIRENVPVGLMVTLRKDKMYDFLNKLINLALPRIRDFRGINCENFDGRGNYNLGLKEQIIFPEIKYDDVDKIRGLNITIVTTAQNDREGLALLQKFGMPFKK
uniref:Large ribosomal subunit protein uL5c n=2 Tax=Gracilariopsis TaxID=2781 RepID=A0A1C9CF63_9FLOR|nr:ribosomal protein L5 [Gracilariopsis lemaneiformis]YP_009294788.1 ribosomal protein L5 [Gracilariopsis chorda]AJO68429.1 ribosomal protein L5 [Gracilariopsis lemaneiformis]AML79901.1 ribosomal protein L5 [Gracilariopsis lemaneiformis]AOM67048.1 ribosomal protein L5 [Gracilariopsis chorda]UAD88893.1 ribosomal protein L5 [Gracilariopsis chorda]